MPHFEFLPFIPATGLTTDWPDVRGQLAGKHNGEPRDLIGEIRNEMGCVLACAAVVSRLYPPQPSGSDFYKPTICN